jgi:hypothetical protein
MIQSGNILIIFGMMEGEVFVNYGWMTREDIPRNVIHVRIHSSVRVIRDRAFSYQSRLEIVIVNKKLEEIGEQAFQL